MSQASLITSKDHVSEDDMFSYRAQRWLWNEPEQLRRRYLKFNLEALIRAVEDTAGLEARCIDVTRLPEGNFNKTFLLTMQDQRQLIARLPNPNAGRPYYTTASEVATMDYVLAPLYCSTIGGNTATDALHRFENALGSRHRKCYHTMHKRVPVASAPNTSSWKNAPALS